MKTITHALDGVQTFLATSLGTLLGVLHGIDPLVAISFLLALVRLIPESFRAYDFVIKRCKKFKIKRKRKHGRKKK